MNETLLDTIDAPRLEIGKPLLVAGLNERYSSKTAAGIPAQAALRFLHRNHTGLNRPCGLWRDLQHG